MRKVVYVLFAALMFIVAVIDSAPARENELGDAEKPATAWIPTLGIVPIPVEAPADLIDLFWWLAKNVSYGHVYHPT